MGRNQAYSDSKKVWAAVVFHILISKSGLYLRHSSGVFDPLDGMSEIPSWLS
jgi:hypothetical protein